MALRHLIATSSDPAGLIIISRELEREAEDSFHLFCHCNLFPCFWAFPARVLARDGAPFGVFGFLYRFEGNLEFKNVLGISTSFAVSRHQHSSSRVCIGVVVGLFSATQQATESDRLLRT